LDSERGRLLLVFLDGVGLAPGDPARNPLAAARLPRLAALLGGGPPVLEAEGVGAAATLRGLDATLGVPGLPQSGTGQTALLTGADAPRLFGRHFGPWVPVALRPLVARDSILARARLAGRRVAFANAYPEELLAAAAAAHPHEAGRTHIGPGPEPAGPAPAAPALLHEAESARTGPGPEPAGPAPAAADSAGRTARQLGAARLAGPLRAGPPLAALGAGVLTRRTPELERGDAVASEIANDGWRERLARAHVPRITPDAAGANLARIAAGHDLTLFAHYATDAAGHHRELAPAVTALERVDAFLGAVLDSLPADVLLLVVSDHGNIEDVEAGHTRNPALCLAAGPGHAALLEGMASLRDVAERVLHRLGVS
jgi:hypothetical protein